MIQFEHNGFFFSASSVVAKFADREETSLDSIDLNPSTPMGAEWILTKNSGDDADGGQKGLGGQGRF